MLHFYSTENGHKIILKRVFPDYLFQYAVIDGATCTCADKLLIDPNIPYAAGNLILILNYF